MTDPISDLLTQIRNALLVRKAEVVLPHSKFKQQLGELLVREGLIDSCEATEEDGRKSLKLVLRYSAGKTVISGIKRISTPGQRIYSKSGDLPRTQSGYGITIVSTSKGLMADRQARKEHLGGEVICQIW